MFTSCWLEALKITEKIIRENAFEHKKESRVKFNPWLSANLPLNNWAQGECQRCPDWPKSRWLIRWLLWHWLLKPQSLSHQHSYSGCGLHSTGLSHSTYLWKEMSISLYEIHVNYHRRSCTQWIVLIKSNLDLIV